MLNVATGKSHSFKRVAELVADQFNRPIKIQQIARSNQVIHKHFDTANLLKAFPSLSLTLLEDGLMLFQAERMKN